MAVSWPVATRPELRRRVQSNSARVTEPGLPSPPVLLFPKFSLRRFGDRQRRRRAASVSVSRGFPHTGGRELIYTALVLYRLAGRPTDRASVRRWR